MINAETRKLNIWRRIGSTLFYKDGVSIFSVLRVADFRNLWFGQLISFLGDALAYNTVTLGVIRMANEADVKPGKILADIAVFSAIPALLLGMIAGTIVDRSNRKHLMILTDILRGFTALGFLLVHDIHQVWIYIVVTVWLSIFSLFFFPARTALLPQILGKSQLLLANTLSQLTVNLAFVVGAATAGVMVGRAGATAPAFIVDSLSFFVSAYFISRMRISGEVPRKTPAVLSTPQRGIIQTLKNIPRLVKAIFGELRVGVVYVLNDQVMRGVMISFLALMAGMGAANVTFVPLLINELGMSEEGIGPIRLSQTLGIILGSTFVATTLSRRYKARDIIGLTMIFFGMTTIMVSVVTNYALMIFVLFIVGLVIITPQIIASTLVQRHVPSEKLGRASGAQGTIINVANIASMGAAGRLLDYIGARMVFTLSGIMVIIAGGISWWALRHVEDDPDPAALSSLVPSPHAEEGTGIVDQV
ncbi:MAG: MFS transporter [Chloroflexi bacterium]|nr:MFS transporter [Chloroflexota bacterium]